MLNVYILSKGNLNQPATYPVPMVTQAPPIQPLPVRPGVIAQVRCRLIQTVLRGCFHFNVHTFDSRDGP